ncbi:MAG: hypothetical protein EON48_03410 [Acetobacteraceae bacterium]|nr:MAG: hypothetical protein EON48_03410 [Acetobacteraceae bacterium]
MSCLSKSVAAAAVLALLVGCGNDKSGANPMVSAIGAMAKQTVAKAKAKKSGAAPASAKAATPAELRAQLEAAGKPVLLASSETLGMTGFLAIADQKSGVITWKTPDGATFSQRNGVLIQTRGLGADLMSAQAPSVGQLLAAGTGYQRVYYFLGDDDQGTRRTYDCVTAIVGKETIDILGRKQSATHVTETCERPLGKLSNDYWIEGQSIRQSRQWVSGRIGYLQFQRIID